MPIHASLRAELGIDEATSAPGGCIHECYRVRIGGKASFLKLNGARFADAFAAEADGLQALRSAGASAPEPLSHGVAGDQAYLLLELLELRGRRDFAALGRMLAHVHRSHGQRFGWPRDNYIGTTPQANRWGDEWAQFWLERRMRPQIELAKRNGFDIEFPPLTLVEHHHPEAALLHGDLWSGNAGFTAAGPVLFDPAVYYGDREADLAMTELFGGFPAAFYAAYNDAYPLDDGYPRRKHLYNFYHLLNHLNLFGGGYLGQVKAVLRLLF
ncbi:MAG: fructosamine kinase family protein [Betaproteobacteria bacterium]|nr:MAG: fructosamine kinase family protein [Betaproteobacteria bacterium]